MKAPTHLRKKTKIVCTIGPASQSEEILEQMIAGGMNVARINFAHGDSETHRRSISNIRTAAKRTGQRVAVFGDLPGPKMRIGQLAEEPIELERGQSFILQTTEVVGTKQRVSTTVDRLPQVVKAGDNVFLNDGIIQLKVEQVSDEELLCRVEVGGELRSHKGLNLPGVDLGTSAFTPQDREFLRFAAEQGLDGVSQSFVSSASDIAAVRAACRQLNYDPFIIAKIERSRALDDMPQILAVADGIMVARGDLGVEIPVEEVAVVQKRLIKLANLKGKPVITATHMLESMTIHRRPTRAEVTDVANAILDGTDGVMLSGETAVGSHPAQAVAMMARIAEVTEAGDEAIGVAEWFKAQESPVETNRRDLISYNIFQSALTLGPAVLFVPSRSGSTARRITRFRLKAWIVAPSLDRQTCQRLQFSYGVYPEHISKVPASWSRFAQEWLEDHGMDAGSIMVVEGRGTSKAGNTTRIDVIDLS